MKFGWPNARRRNTGGQIGKCLPTQGVMDPGWLQIKSAGPPGARGNNLGFRPSNGANVNLPRARVSSLVCNPTQKRLGRGSQNQHLKGEFGEGLKEGRLSPKCN